MYVDAPKTHKRVEIPFPEGVPFEKVGQQSASRHRKPKKVAVWKIILGSVLLGASGLIYLNHVFETQRLLKDVIELQREYDQVRRRHADRLLTYQRMTGPAEVYAKAKEIGLENGSGVDPIIVVEE